MDEEVTAQTTPLHIVLSHFALSLSPEYFHACCFSIILHFNFERERKKTKFCSVGCIIKWTWHFWNGSLEMRAILFWLKMVFDAYPSQQNNNDIKYLMVALLHTFTSSETKIQTNAGTISNWSHSFSIFWTTTERKKNN